MSEPGNTDGQTPVVTVTVERDGVPIFAGTVAPDQGDYLSIHRGYNQPAIAYIQCHDLLAILGAGHE